MDYDSCSRIVVTNTSTEHAASVFRLQDRSSLFLRNVGCYLRNYTIYNQETAMYKYISITGELDIGNEAERSRDRSFCIVTKTSRMIEDWVWFPLGV
jgi:hypothetical protein